MAELALAAMCCFAVGMWWCCCHRTSEVPTGCDAACDSDEMSTYLRVTISGVTGCDCSDNANPNGTYLLEYAGEASCTWFYLQDDEPIEGCGGVWCCQDWTFGMAVEVTLTDAGLFVVRIETHVQQFCVPPCDDVTNGLADHDCWDRDLTPTFDCTDFDESFDSGDKSDVNCPPPGASGADCDYTNVDITVVSALS